MFDLNTSILDPEYGEELDEKRLREYIDSLMAEFADSPEAAEFQQEFNTRLGWPATYMHYAAQHLGVTPATMNVIDSEEVLFELFPRKVSVDAEKAGQIIGELRAFWQYLKRTRSLESADDILERLTEDDADRLEAELADEDNYGMAKSFFMAGQKAGYDMTNEADINRFMQVHNARLQSAMAPRPVAGEAPSQRSRQHVTAPIQNTERRVGRNEPCPCGSGRKYKKCCGG